MFKRLIKNIIPFALLLHISSCSSFGVSKSEMNGACGIIDEVLSTDNLNSIEGTIKDHNNTETKINDLLHYKKTENRLLLSRLKKDIETWGKTDFNEAVTECLTHNDKEDNFSYNTSLQNNQKNIDIENFNEFKKSFDTHEKTFKKSYNGHTGHLACARLIAVDLDKGNNELSYRVKYLPYIFRSGYSSNRNKMNLPNNYTATNLFKSLRFIDDYGFQDTNFCLRTDNAPKDSDPNSHHTDSERALLLCLTEKAPKTISYSFDKEKNKPFELITNEESYKLANFVHENTIDLCIQVRNQNAMCGNCQCFYAGRDKVDLNGRGGIFLERGDQNDPSGDSRLNILSILDRMEKRKKNGKIPNNYLNSLFLATRHGNNQKYGTKVSIGNKNKDSQFPEKVLAGEIVHDTDAKQEYEKAKGTYYSRYEDTAYINGFKI